MTVAKLYTVYVYPNNHWIYNLYTFVFFGLFYKMVYDHIQNSTRKNILAALSLLMMLGLIVRAVTTPVLTHFMDRAFTAGTIVMIFNLMYYAIDLLKNNQKIQLKSNLQFFVFAAYLIFGITFIPLSYFLFGQAGDGYSDRFYTVFRAIHTAAIVGMHGLLIFGFIWTKPKLARKIS